VVQRSAGFLVAATSPGWALAFDAATYGLAALAIGAMHLPRGLRIEGSTVLLELRDGWRDFWSRPWLWAIVLQFGVVNAVENGAVQIFGPTVAKNHLGGPAAWGAVLTAVSLGLVLSGVLMLRWHPRRILLVATLAVFPFVLPLLALAGPAPLAIVIAAGFLAGFCVEIFGVLWDTAMQQEIPLEKLSRLSAYDALGSLVLTPIALAALGPIGAVAGIRATLIGLRCADRRRDRARPALTRRPHARAADDLAFAQDVPTGDLCERQHDDLVDVHVRRARQREHDAVGNVLGPHRAAHRDVRVDRVRLLFVALEAHLREVRLDHARCERSSRAPACPGGRRAAHACSRAPRTSTRRTTKHSRTTRCPRPSRG